MGVPRGLGRMTVVHQVIHTACQREEDRQVDRLERSLLGRLSLSSRSNNNIKNNVTRRNEVPNTIEDVPFRRQDIRILNAKKRRMMDRKLILFLVTTTTLFLPHWRGSHNSLLSPLQ